MRRSLFPSLLSILFLSVSAFPWGKVGHETIAYIAEHNLSPEILAKIKPLLGGMNMEEAAVWADLYKGSHRNTAPWHYMDLRVGENVGLNNVEAAKSQNQGNNVLYQLEKNIQLLKMPGIGLQDRQKSLWFVIHFMGDIHMPLHVGDDNDAGGNGKKVRFFSPASRSNRGHVTNLHSLWDNLIEIKAAEDSKTLGQELAGKITPAERREWLTGTSTPLSASTVEKWAFESYTIAKTVIYPGMGTISDSVTVLKRDYHARMRPVVDEQIEKAGVRLAKVLEEVFR